LDFIVSPKKRDNIFLSLLKAVAKAMAVEEGYRAQECDATKA